MPAKVTERTFYPHLLDLIRKHGGEGAAEIKCDTTPDLVFRLPELPDTQWLLSVKIGEAASILKNAFLQYLAHKRHCGLDYGLILLLPDEVRRLSLDPHSLSRFLSASSVVALIDTPFVQSEIRAPFPDILNFLKTGVAPKIRQKIEQGYPLPLVIQLLREQVLEMMQKIRLSEERLVKIIAGRDLLAGLGRIREDEADQVLRFLSAYLLLSQLLFLRLLAPALKDRISLPDPREVDRDRLREIFRRILDINYRPIYETDVLDFVDEKYIRQTYDLITGLRIERVRYELPGRLFHELMPPTIRKLLAAFYTRPQAARLLAWLAIEDAGASVMDPACGSGTILVEAYRRKRLLWSGPSSPHRRFCEEDLTGIDIMPFAAHLAVANLAAMEPETTLAQARIGVANSLELGPQGRIQAGAGMLLLPGWEQTMGVGSRAAGRGPHGEPTEFELRPVKVLLMNPPFTKIERGIQRHFSLERFKEICGGEVGLWGHFLALAHNFVEEDGIIGAVIPINFLRGRESRKIRDFVFSEWSPLYILKPVLNYGFSEWAEYRDIILIARRRKPSPNHRVRFALIKTDLTQLGEQQIDRIAEDIRRHKRLRREDLDIESFSIKDLRQRMNNMMWFCSTGDFRRRDVLVEFVEKFFDILKPPAQWDFATGYRPEGGAAGFLFLTREGEGRTEEAFLLFRDEDEKKDEIRARSRLRLATFRIERSVLLPSLRTPVGLRTMGLDGRWDYLAVRPYSDLSGVCRAAGLKMPGKEFWESLARDLERIRGHGLVAQRLNPFSPNTRLIAFFSDKPVYPSDLFHVIRLEDPEHVKALVVLLNSAIFLAQVFLIREETTGRYLHLRIYDLEECALIPDSRRARALARIYDRFSDTEFPSLRDGLDRNFNARYKMFWQEKRSGQMGLPLLTELADPHPTRLEFDLEVCRALRVKVSEEEMIRVYTAITMEMILTRGLQRD